MEIFEIFRSREYESWLSKNGIVTSEEYWVSCGEFIISYEHGRAAIVSILKTRYLKFTTPKLSKFNLNFSNLFPDIKSKIYFHYSEFSSLHSHLGRECLPEEYGGLDGKLNYEDLNDMLRKEANIFDSLKNYGWDQDADIKKKQIL